MNLNKIEILFLLLLYLNNSYWFYFLGSRDNKHFTKFHYLCETNKMCIWFERKQNRHNTKQLRVSDNDMSAKTQNSSTPPSLHEHIRGRTDLFEPAESIRKYRVCAILLSQLTQQLLKVSVEKLWVWQVDSFTAGCVSLVTKQSQSIKVSMEHDLERN